MLIAYTYEPLLVDLPDLVVEATVVKRRARRFNLSLPESPDRPCVLDVEVIPYAGLPAGGYGDELTSGPFRRSVYKLSASPFRLVDAHTGRIVASKFLPDGQLRTDAEWEALVQQVRADDTVTAMRQSDWFCQMLRQVPVVVDAFIEQNILLAAASGDLG